LVPTAFLVLGGMLLDGLFPTAFSNTFWIVLMALMVLPVCLTPTLKEGAGAAFAGCVGTIVADVVGIGMLIHGMDGHPSVPSPDVSFEQVVTTFGNLALAYGAAIVIPSLQRQHKQPERMPQVVGITMVFITVLFIAMAWSGYSAVGCQISGNLLFNVFPNASGITSLGMKARYGSAVIAYLFMQMHITIAFSVVLYPVFYVLERVVLGMHSGAPTSEVVDEEAAIQEQPYRTSETPKDSAKLSFVDETAVSHDHDDADDYKGSGTVAKYVLLRIIVVAVLVVVAIVLQDKFIDLSDFVGASCITCCAIVLPILFYQKKMGTRLPLYERILGFLVVVICTGLGAYVTYKTGKNLFAPGSGDGYKFPFCEAEHRMTLYYTKP
jgi:solute carrier family 32 (vesicular inhibitory amino acid transporter)